MTEQSQAKIVEEILGAKTLYDVLGVSPQNLDEATLRKAYLKTSVKVHPDKNNHPQATQAFQRVAEAHGTLSDASARAVYDAELRNPRSSAGGNPCGNNTQYAYDFDRDMPSFQEALFMFATVTSMFSSSGGGAASTTRSGSAVNAATDFVETLFWAQKLAEERQKQSPQDNNSDPTSRSAGVAEAASKDPFTSGMALGSGLRAFASAQRAMGLNKSATATEKAASTVQMAAVGATVLKAANENPAVKRTLERGQDALKNNPQISKGFRASLKVAGSIITTLAEAKKEAEVQRQQEQQQNGGNRRY